MDGENKVELLKSLIADAELKYQRALNTIEELQRLNQNKNIMIFYYKQKLNTEKNDEKEEKEIVGVEGVLEEARKEIEKLKENEKKLVMQLYDHKTRGKKYREEIAEYKKAFRRMQKELVEAKKEVKAFETILDPNSSTTLTEDSYTERELAYRRIAQKYKEKCEACPLRVKKRKNENVWMD